MTSWHPDRIPGDGYKMEGFHRNDNRESEGIGQGTFDNFRRIGHFALPGVEKHSGAIGFAYGSDRSYDHRLTRDGSWYGHRLDNRTSVERIKLKKQQKEVEEDHRAYLTMREQERREKVEEKRKDLDQLQKYNPWGKPAGGAPRVTPSGFLNTRIQKFEADSETSSLPKENQDPESKYNPYGKPGAGAPQRTKSGKITAQIKGAKDIRFQDHLKKEVDCLRYKPDGSSEADSRRGNQKRQQDHTLGRVDSEKLRIMEEKERKIKYAKKLEEQCLEALDRREREKREEKETSPAGYIWGKNKVNRDESGKLLPRKRVIDSDSYTDHPSQSGITSLAAQMGREGCGAPVKDHRGNVHTKFFRENNTGQSLDDFDPWGKPGAGAPLRDKHGQVVATGVYGKHTRELEKRSAHTRVPVDKTRASQEYGIDMATWMRAKDVERRHDTGQYYGPNYNMTSIRGDKSKDYFTDLQAQAECRYKQLQQKKHEDRQMDALHSERVAQMWDKGSLTRGHRGGNKEYSDELRRTMEERSIQKQQSRENNIAMEKQHVSTFNQHWGRPGAGAPRFDSQGQMDTVPKNLSSLQAHTKWHFRNT